MRQLPEPGAVSALRTCVGCPAQLDLAAQLSGQRFQPGWVHVCCGVLCPSCWDSGHWPTYLPIPDSTAAYPACGCGYQGEEPAATLADVKTAWVDHYRQTVSAPAGMVPRR